MIVLDTNVLSELLRAIPEPAVVRWTASQPLNTLFTTTVTQAEMLYGARLLSAGQRRRQLEQALAALFEEDFAGRVLPFDGDAAFAYAGIAAERKRSGRPISQFDAQIAAIARSRGSYLATRNVGDFAACELQIINPWQPE
ncbi:VapC ribonuclease Y4jK [Candidatus Accumulibacter aalborgensis]|uniref:Ribonuclease VapC n=1 Tax=Candidatus Accumulibacter aalborgensis TaxID=1860102 RepID=A0A1A8XYA3_9PROT|nr:type II toxin-antitoxin system VapC family toxin [Candidatus Accumulibacter aalborgensis]SBT09033.1 VapC ribonuclease Y4jK [Candidatus Accumulibacter aalborgensis]